MRRILAGLALAAALGSQQYQISWALHPAGPTGIWSICSGMVLHPPYHVYGPTTWANGYYDGDIHYLSWLGSAFTYCHDDNVGPRWVVLVGSFDPPINATVPAQWTRTSDNILGPADSVCLLMEEVSLGTYRHTFAVPPLFAAYWPRLYLQSWHTVGDPNRGWCFVGSATLEVYRNP